MSTSRPLRAGESIEDFCRQCKTDRLHNIVVVDTNGQPIRVVCGYCRSEHNYRGGPRVASSGEPAPAAAPMPAARPVNAPPILEEKTYRRTEATGAPFDLVGARERTGPAMSVTGSSHDLESLLRRVIREESGISSVVPAEKWRGGSFVLRPGTPGLQEKSWPIETFFHKIVMLRNRLRTLEQQVNASDLPDDMKVKLQSYVTGCYGSLTSFNVLFADEDDQFKGAGE